MEVEITLSGTFLSGIRAVLHARWPAIFDSEFSLKIYRPKSPYPTLDAPRLFGKSCMIGGEAVLGWDPPASVVFATIV